MIDRNLLAENLQIFLNTYHHARYRGIALSVKEVLDGQVVFEVLQTLLPTWRIWQMGQGNDVPDLSCHRLDFIQQSIEQGQRENLLVLYPEEWMQSWNLVDKESFWTSLAESFGRHTVITISFETHETLRLLSASFKAWDMEASPVQLWLSKHQPWD
ncbi:hypothetical protein [Candidatus Venteria ishoeyi]|uniref:Uncharacterized protein n=1 Tax=Candidatus Venteria ishoeyi TaxID=1899563 RepID=A0A1H6F9V6_9GAMM|nr:hypothetical protein [Candidatus Venteria ishoeyi]MDM8545779.1 hypothetical protein [Candidatus Venteria ishoeyi]SEH06868.1 Uncharacterised protein [Candidatus Venteria ishoeyi]